MHHHHHQHHPHTPAQARRHRHPIGTAIALAWCAMLVMLVMPMLAGNRVMAEEAAAPADQPAAPQSFALRPAFKAGQVTRYEFYRQGDVMQRVQLPTGNVSEDRSSFVAEGEVTWRVERVNDDGSAQCTLTVDWIASRTADRQGQETVNDSREATGDDETAHKVLRAAAGEPVTIRVAADGAIIDVQGVERIQRKIGEGDHHPQVRGMLDYQNLAANLATLPSAPETGQVGSTWNHTFTRKYNEAMSVNNPSNIAVAGIELIAGIPVATVTMQARSELDLDASQLPGGGENVNIQLTSGRLNSQVMFDLQRREVVGRHQTQQQSMRITINHPAGQIIRDDNASTLAQILRIAEQD